MTSPTAEQRAGDLFEKLYLDGICVDGDGASGAFTTLIASAIRQAEDAAYERAAVVLDGQLADSKAAVVRSLKHPKET